MKDTLIKGTIILTLAAFTARFLGLIQRVPLKHLLGDAGMASYGISYNLYHVILIIATAGIPSALSKLISERTALGKDGEAQHIFNAAVIFAIFIGIIATVLVWLVAPFYAIKISRDPDAVLAIRALAPALLFFPLIAMMRGYFLGRQNMTAGAMSQIFEQIFRVLTAVGLAYIILRLGYDMEWAIAGASFGGVVGGIAAFAVMLYYWRMMRIKVTAPANLSYRSIYATIFKFSIPVSLISIAVPLIYLIDSSTVIALLEKQMGYEAAKETLGILTGRAQSIAGIPPILAIAVSQSIIPIISAAYAQRDQQKVDEQASLAFRFSFIACLPMIIFLTVAARPVNVLLFGDAAGTTIMMALTAGTAFHVLMMVSGAVLLGLGQAKAAVRYVYIGIAVKLIGSYVLAPWLSIYGIIIATALCFIVMMQLNFKWLRKSVSFTILGQRWGRLLLAVAISFAIGISCEWALHHYLKLTVPMVASLIHAFILGTIVVLLYMVLLIKLKVMTETDISRLPARLQKWLKPILTRIA